MPLRTLTSRERSPAANRNLAALLAFTAGAVDVCGFLAFKQFTSHVSGLVAFIAATARHDTLHIILPPAAVFASFLTGAAFSAILINFLRRRHWESEYALPVLLEALLLTLVCAISSPSRWLSTLMLLAFSMGLQNATITKISRKEIRTTHVTGMVTDIGIHLGKALYWNRNPNEPDVQADREHLLLLLLLVALFFSGGIAAAVTYPSFGFRVLLPLASLLALLTVHPIHLDLRRR